MLAQRRSLAAYLLLLGGSIAAYLAIRAVGARLTAPALAAGQAAFGGGASPHVDHLLHVLVALLVITALSRALGRVCMALGQPRVIGEILAGILLGPSLLGRLAPTVAGFILPPVIAPSLQVIAQLGVILFMFLVGIELDPSLLRRRGHATVAISHASILVPFLLGSLLGLWLYPLLSSRDVPFTVFSLFMGVSMSVTAFPVLARILTDRGMQRSPLGVMALACAAIDDLTAWCLLAFVVSVARSQVLGSALTVALVAGYLLAVLFLLRPAVQALCRRVDRAGSLGQGDTALALLLLLASALATDAIGIHAVFGAFALGACIPEESTLGRGLTGQLGNLVVVLFLPAFFAYTGMRTQIGLVSGAAQWVWCAAIIAVASVGKLGGSAIGARWSGMSWRDASALGILMNTRGLMELVVLNLGLELRIISPTLFAMLVLMALVTTAATTPVLAWIERARPVAQR